MHAAVSVPAAFEGFQRHPPDVVVAACRHPARYEGVNVKVFRAGVAADGRYYVIGGALGGGLDGVPTDLTE